MDSSFSPKDEIWFLRVCHHISNAVYQISFPGVKRPGRGVDHPPLTSAEVKQIGESYLYFPYWFSCPVKRCILLSLLLSTTQRYVGLYVKWQILLSAVNLILSFSTDGRTDMTKPTSAFRYLRECF